MSNIQAVKDYAYEHYDEKSWSYVVECFSDEEIAREIAEILRKNVTVDWAVRDSVRAKLRVLVKTLLKRYKYPPDQQEKATELVLSQAAVISDELAA